MNTETFMYILLVTMLAMGIIPILLHSKLTGSTKDLFLALGIILSMIVAGSSAVILITEYARATGQL